MSLNCLMIPIQCRVFRSILCTSQKSMKNYSLNLHDETLSTIPTIYVYINRNSNRLMLEIKDRYKLESQALEIINLFGSKKINKQ